MGPTLYNLKCTCVLLNCWDPWRFHVSFWADFQDTCPILISLLFYTLYTMGPHIKSHLTRRLCVLKLAVCFLVFWKLLLKGHWLYQVLYVLFFKWRKPYIVRRNLSSVIMCLLWSTEPIWYEVISSVLSWKSLTLLTLPFG